MKSTLILPVDPDDILSSESQASLSTAAGILRAGGTVAFPTETVYGLGANALDAEAVDRIFVAKQRPSWDPLIVHIADETTLQEVVQELSAIDREIMNAFWPGALTLLIPKREIVPSNVTAGRIKVGVRMPAHPVALALLHMAGIPVAAPSANSFSKISPTTAQHVLEDLEGRIDAVVDGGATRLGLESTVIDTGTIPPLVYRPGMISLEELQRYVPDVRRYVSEQTITAPQAQPSPGVGIRHYAPRAVLILMSLDKFAVAVEIAGRQSEATGVLLPEGLDITPASTLQVFPWGRWNDSESLASSLYAGLRQLDLLGVRRILCPRPEGDGVEMALRDRLEKAARPKE